jgi:hypothetical protein
MVTAYGGSGSAAITFPGQWTPPGIMVKRLCGRNSRLLFAITAHYWSYPIWTGLESTRGPKTLWDWLELLIVPTVLAFGTFWLNHQVKQRESVREHQRTQDEMLKEYLDQMTHLVPDNGLATAARQRLAAADGESPTLANIDVARCAAALTRYHFLSMLCPANWCTGCRRKDMAHGQTRRGHPIAHRSDQPQTPPLYLFQ